MPYASALHDQLLIELVRKGWSDDRIAAEFHVSRQNVSKRRQKLLGKRVTVADKINELLRFRWPEADLKSESSYHLRGLKLWLRLQYGDKLSEQKLKRANTWVADRAKDQQVLTYDVGQGSWVLRDRRPEDGRILIDWPKDLPFPTTKFRHALELPTTK